MSRHRRSLSKNRSTHQVVSSLWGRYQIWVRLLMMALHAMKGRSSTITKPRLGMFINTSRSREHSQVALNFAPEAAVDGVTPMNPSPMILESAANALSKFGFDCIYYRRSKQDLLSNGWSEEQIFGRSEVDVDSVLLGFADPQDSQPVPAWCARTVNKILPTANLPVRLASSWLLTKLMRVSTPSSTAGRMWLTASQYLIWPSVENMSSYPDWLMPSMGRQDVSPYDVLIDLVPWYV